MATGCRERPFGALSIAGTRPAGIFTAGTAQEMLNIFGWDVGERIVILGSGDVGMIMAGRFAELGKEVIAMVEQEQECTGLVRNRKRYIDPYNIPLLTQSTISRVFGRRRLVGVEVQTWKNGTDEYSRIDCDTLLVSVGLIPETDLLRGLAPAVPTPAAPTSVTSTPAAPTPWLFICGNAREVQTFVDDVYDDGIKAGKAAADYLNEFNSG